MDAASYATLLGTLFAELVHGSPDPKGRTYILNQGDTGLLASLDRLSATAASVSHDGPSVAAHVDHLRYGLSLLNRWATGSAPPWPDMDWTVSWEKNVVSDIEHPVATAPRRASSRGGRVGRGAPQASGGERRRGRLDGRQRRTPGLSHGGHQADRPRDARADRRG